MVKYKDHLIKYLSSKESFKFSRLKKSEKFRVLNEMLDLLSLPHPSSNLEEYFIHPNVTRELAFELFNTDLLTPDDRKDITNLSSRFLSSFESIKSDSYYRIRFLAMGWIYPNIEVERGGSLYFIEGQKPVLVTKNRNTNNIFGELGTINWLTKNELKFVTAITCASERTVFYFQFTNQDAIDIDADVVKGASKLEKTSFFKEYFDMRKKFIPIWAKAWHRRSASDVLQFEFLDFREALPAFRRIYDKFSTTNHLLLRTSSYFSKAIVHWDNQLFSEEAIVNTFFALEGCLHLIQKKYGDYEPRLNLKLLESIFREDIPFGENLFEFIKEAYEKRITLVHPEPEWWAEFNPWITHEDFYEYFWICRSLLNFILIDRHLTI